MKVSASALLLSAALGVSAHPSGHARLHKKDFVVAVKPVTTTVVEYQVAAAEATTTSTSTTAAAAATSTTASSSDYVEFCSGSSSKRATTEEIAYTGNTGTADDYGCNMMVVSNDIVSLYDYSTVFTNSVDEAQTCVCWNKIGPDGGINGFFKGNEAITFTLPASGKKTVVFEANTQGGCACSVGSEVATTTYGQYASTWLEFDFANTSNDDWSGADASCLVSAAYSLSIPALEVCFDGTCSTIENGGTGTNAYLGGMEDEDGVGLNINKGDVSLKVTVGQ